MIFKTFPLLPAHGERIDQQRLPILPASILELHFAQLLHRPHRRQGELDRGRGGGRMRARGVPRDGAATPAALAGQQKRVSASDIESPQVAGFARVRWFCYVE